MSAIFKANSVTVSQITDATAAGVKLMQNDTNLQSLPGDRASVVTFKTDGTSTSTPGVPDATQTPVTSITSTGGVPAAIS